MHPGREAMTTTQAVFMMSSSRSVRCKVLADRNEAKRYAAPARAVKPDQREGRDAPPRFRAA
jgi:hypothetical protein